MSASYHIDPDDRVVYSVGTGVFGDEDLRKHQESLAADPLFDPSYRQLWDLRTVEQIEVTSGGVWQRAHNNPWGAGAKRAVVVGSELGYGIARMFQIMSTDGPDEIEIFRELAPAREWLGLKPG